MTRTRLLLCSTVLGTLALFFYMWGIAGMLQNGDEAIYAQLGREMVQTGDLWTPRFQGEPILARPPASIWAVAAAIRLFGPSEAAIRGVVALESAIVVALLFSWVAIRFRRASATDAPDGSGALADGITSTAGAWRAALFSALLLATADRFFKYARYVESEPLLLLFIVGAMVAWEKAQQKRGWLVAFAACVAGSLMTKQIIGAFPLGLVAVDALLSKSRRVVLSPRTLAGKPMPWIALGVVAVTVLPWHLFVWRMYGKQFIDTFFLANLVHRSTSALHGGTTAWFYLELLWKADPVLLVGGLLGGIWALTKREPLPLAWTLFGLVPYSFAASRYDYYALLFYPGLALGIGWALGQLSSGGRGAALTYAVGSAAVLANLLFLFPRVGKPLGVDTELAPMFALLARSGSPQDRLDGPLLMVREYPYAARFYTQAETKTLLFDKAAYEARQFEHHFGVPGQTELAEDLRAYLSGLPRWTAIVSKRDSVRLNGMSPVYTLFQTKRYLLLANRPLAANP